MTAQQSKVMLLGGAGGIGSAFLNILALNDISASIIPHGTHLLVVDQRDEIPISDRLKEKYVVSRVSGFSITNSAVLEKLLVEHGINALIEVADVETIQFVKVCTKLGVLYINSGYGVWPEVYEREHPRCLMLVRAMEIRRQVTNNGYRGVIMGSGMNPGIVNALVETGIQRMANLNCVNKKKLVADLKYIIFTEEDTTSIPESTFNHSEFPITWNPQHAYSEFTESSTGYVTQGKVKWIESKPLDCIFDVICNDKIITGMLVPHEEVVTIGEKYPNITSGFIYCIPPVSLRRLPTVRDLKWIKPMLLVPKNYELQGYDTVGVLLQTQRFGSCWLGFKNYHHEAVCYDTNATLMQVAAGVLAGTSLLMKRFSSASVVEDLDYQAYLDIACKILGPIVEKTITDDQSFHGFE
jgi:homospermidine synthase